MTVNEMREKTAAELKKEVLQLCQERFNIRMSKGEGQNIKTHRFGQIRREIAQLKTIMKEKG